MTTTTTTTISGEKIKDTHLSIERAKKFAEEEIRWEGTKTVVIDETKEIFIGEYVA